MLTWTIFVFAVRIEDGAAIRGPEKVVEHPPNGRRDQSGQVRRMLELVQERVSDGRGQLQVAGPEEVLVEVGVEGEREEFRLAAGHEALEDVAVGKFGQNEVAWKKN